MVHLADKYLTTISLKTNEILRKKKTTALTTKGNKGSFKKYNRLEEN